MKTEENVENKTRCILIESPEYFLEPKFVPTRLLFIKYLLMQLHFIRQKWVRYLCIFMVVNELVTNRGNINGRQIVVVEMR